MANLKYSSKGLELTKQFEGLELQSYQDSVGVWTIGYGHTGSDVVPGMTISEQQATILLAADVAWAVTCVNKSVKSQINQNQFDALVDFTFNLGCANLGSSTLLRLINAGDYTGAAAQFLRWNKAGGKVLKGLTKRRQAETDLFSTLAAPMRTGIALKAAAVKKKSKKAAKKTAAKKAAKAAAKKKAQKAPATKKVTKAPARKKAAARKKSK
jgi:lysozyme